MPMINIFICREHLTEERTIYWFIKLENGEVFWDTKEEGNLVIREDLVEGDIIIDGGVVTPDNLSLDTYEYLARMVSYLSEKGKHTSDNKDIPCSNCFINSDQKFNLASQYLKELIAKYEHRRWEEDGQDMLVKQPTKNKIS